MAIKAILSRIYSQDRDNTRSARSGVNPSCSCCYLLSQDRVRLENEKLVLETSLKASQTKVQELERLLGLEHQRVVDLTKEREKRKHKPMGPNTSSSKTNFKPNTEEDERKKKGGAKKGHKGHGRKPFKDEEVDRVVETLLEKTCPCCQGDKIQIIDGGQRDILDLPLNTVEKVRYRVLHGECLVCGTSLKEETISAMPKSMYSNSLIARIATDHYLSGISLGTILGQLKLTEKLPSVINSMHRLGTMTESAYDKIILDYRNRVARHADETPWRTDGKNGYAWGFFALGVAVFVVGVSRSAATVRKILGETALAGVLVVDRYAGYNKAPCAVQYCYAHLDRDINEDKDEFESDVKVTEFLSGLSFLFKEAMILPGKKLEDAEYYAEANRIKASILKMTLTPSGPYEHLCIKAWRELIRDNEDRLFHWVNDRRVRCENNQAERDVRKLVIARKMSFGSQSEKGAKTRQHIMTLLGTAKKRLPPEKDVATWLRDALDAVAAGHIHDLYEALPPLPTE